MNETGEPKESKQIEEAKGCPVQTSPDSEPCGRAIHNAPAGVDKEPVCLMHSNDPSKNDAQFQQELDRTLAEAGDGLADFSDFVFPSANYRHREFKASCLFLRATFTQAADFGWASFTRAAHFADATFTQDASFIEARFTRGADFRATTFTQATLFRETVFREDSGLVAWLLFGLATFEKPEAVVFYRTYLGQALFSNCDVSKVTFSNVRWRERKNGKRTVFEELVDLTPETAEALRPPKASADERNYALIAELYQQLKKNYDDRGDYWTAGDFHYGEMEMKRLSSRRKNPIWRWLHRHLGLVAWYRYASEYGESYARPAASLLFFLLVFFPALYPLIGLRAAKPAEAVSTVAQSGQASYPPTLSYSAYIHSAAAQTGGHSLTIWELIGNSLRASVDIALLRPALAYEPAGDAGWALSRVQFVLTSTLFALFLLAVRRQFRR